MLAFASVFLILSSGSLLALSEKADHHHQYCIIGAGPGGLQVAFYLQRAQRDYVIFERNTTAGSFFLRYPRHRKLISINKRHTGKDNPEFNLRHDWNSLLSDDPSLLYKHYSKDFFPQADTMVRYLQDFAKKFDLNIQYNTTIVNVEKVKKTFYLHDQRNVVHTCRYLIVATGIWVPNAPNLAAGTEFVRGYEDMSLDRDDYEGKTVLILGRGNSAFETADHIGGSTNLIHMMGRSRVKLSWSTHYVGDLRAINNGLLDTYQLKSLDALLEGPVESLVLRERNGKIWVDESAPQMGGEGNDVGAGEDGEGKATPDSIPDNFALREPYDIILRCLGFKFDKSIFNTSCAPVMGKGKTAKYPVLKPNYESSNVRHMYFAGCNSHFRDFRKSSGAFVHGFRYTARALFRHMEWAHHGVKWPSNTVPITELIPALLMRVNEMSGPYQMFGILIEVVSLNMENGTATLLEEVPIDCMPNFYKCTGHKLDKFIVINLEYGKNFSGPANDVFHEMRATGEPSEADESNFLHPVMYYYKEPFTAMARPMILPRPDHLLHLVEDFLTSWDAPVGHILPLRRFLEEVLGTDLRHYYAETCFKYAMTFSDLPKFCEQQYLQGHSVLLATPELIKPITDRGLGDQVFSPPAGTV